MAVQTDPYTFVNGTVANALEVNARFDNLYNLQNGGIDGTNMDLTATFAWTGPHSITSTATTGDIFTVTGNSLTTGSLGVFTSNSTDTGTRALVDIINDNALATGATVLRLQQDSTNNIVEFFGGATSVFSVAANGDPTWESGAGFNMTFVHAATADRTITFPDVTDTVVTLTTLSIPTITDFTSAQHDHSNAANGGALAGQDTALITTGTFADARIAASNVTQHEAALTITESQITDAGLLARNAGTETISGAWTFSNSILVPETDPPTSTRMVTAESLCKGYVLFTTNGSGASTIVSSYNVSSISDDTGADEYTILWNNDFTSANYVVIGTAGGGNNQIVQVVSQTAGTAVVQIIDTNASTFQNNLTFYVAAFGTIV